MELRDYQVKAVSDIHKAWAAAFRRPCLVMPCGAGKSVITAEIARKTTLNKKRVLFIVHRKELCEQIYETFSSYGVDMSLCEIGMVQTVCRRTEKMLPPALIITDENHHCLAASYKKIYAAFPGAYCLGVTATPVRLNGGGLGDINDCLIIGPSVKELISRNCLAPFDYYAPALADLSGIRVKSTGDFDEKEIETALNKPKIYGDVISYYRRLTGGAQAVCYCPTINFSRYMADEFTAKGILAAHIDGNTPKSERTDIIGKFRSGSIKILCNVDLISEGFDVPDVSAAILLRPTKSLTLYIQQAMRCMRYKQNKRAVIIDHVGNVHRFGLPDQDFEWSIDPAPPKKAQSKTEGTIKIRQCPECFAAHKYADVCPLCGYIYPKEEHVPETEEEIRLKKITETVRHYTRPGECQSRAELTAYRKKMNYKPGWEYHAAKALNLWK